MIKKILKIIGIIVLLILLAVILMVVVLFRDPGLYLRVLSDKLSEDKVVEVSYNYDFESTSETKTVPYFYFTPSESGNYTFTAADLESSSDVQVTVNVTNKYLDDYFVANNRDRGTGELKDTISDSASLQASQVCYVLFTVEPLDENLDKFSGSFKLTVTKGAEDEGPPHLTTDGSVNVRVDAAGQACASFIPPETGYYKFEHSIVSKDYSKGYSSISSVTSSNKLKVGVTSDICMLIKDQEYYVWVTANETDSTSSVIELSCEPMLTEKADGICSVDLTGDSVVEYVADKECDLAVYTVSSGDPQLVIYEKAGFPLRTDDRSEASLSDNPDDVATVLRVEEGTGLRICIFGDVTDCRVFITEYTGDGTSLTIDDLVPAKEKEPEQPEQAEQPEQTEQPDEDKQ